MRAALRSLIATLGTLNACVLLAAYLFDQVLSAAYNALSRPTD